MRAAGSLEYAFARMQARLSRRASEGTWAAIEEARAIAPILDAARGTSLERLLEHLPPEADLPGVDAAAHRAWSRTVTEATAWMPAEWAPALAWCDSVQAPHPTLLPALGNPAWRRQWPVRGSDPGLVKLAHTVADHRARFRLALPHEATPLRRAFESQLLAFFRRRPAEPSGAFAWLALDALDLERLRGEIARRLAFPAARIVA